MTHTDADVRAMVELTARADYAELRVDVVEDRHCDPGDGRCLECRTTFPCATRRDMDQVPVPPVIAEHVAEMATGQPRIWSGPAAGPVLPPERTVPQVGVEVRVPDAQRVERSGRHRSADAPAGWRRFLPHGRRR